MLIGVAIFVAVLFAYVGCLFVILFFGVGFGCWMLAVCLV